VDEDYSVWVLLHQTTDAVAKARQKELNQSGISFIAEEESIWSCQTSPVLPQVGSKKLMEILTEYEVRHNITKADRHAYLRRDA
jgi:hypothetical protein